MAQQWYCRNEKQELGPIPARELRRLARIGKVNPHTEVRLDADGAWIAAGLVPGLFSGRSKARKKPGEYPRRNAAAEALATMTLDNAASDEIASNDANSTLASKPEVEFADEPEFVDFDPAEAKFSAAPLPPEIPTIEVDADDPATEEEPLLPNFPPIQVEVPPVAARTAASSPDRRKAVLRQINVLCIVAGLLSVIAVGVYAIPLLPIVIGLAAVVLAVRALGKVDGRLGIGFGLPAVSTALSVFVVCIGFYTTIFYGGGISRLGNMFASLPEQPPTDDPLNQPPVEPAIRWHSILSGPVAAGDLSISVPEVGVGSLPSQAGRAAAQVQSEVGEHVLYITVAITNRSDNRKIDYDGWSGLSGSRLAAPLLADNFDNRYQRVRFRAPMPGVEQASRAAIYPGKTVFDTLVFQPPVESFKYLRLTLPGAAFGEETTLHLELPKLAVGEKIIESPPVAVVQVPPTDPADNEVVDTRPPVVDFDRDTTRIPPEGEPQEGDDNLERLANQDPDFQGGPNEIPLPGERPRVTQPEDNSGEGDGDGGFVRSPFGGKDNNRPAPPPVQKPKPPQRTPREAGVVDPVLPLHGGGIANPQLVKPEDLAPPRNDPFRDLD